MMAQTPVLMRPRHYKENNFVSAKLTFLSFFLLVQNLLGVGVAMIKEQPFHNDTSAKPVIITGLKDSNGPLIVLETSSRNITIERAKLAGHVEVFNTLPSSITTEVELQPIINKLNELRNFSKRFSQSESILKGHIEPMSQVVNRFESGEVRYNDNWIARSSYNQILEQLDAESQALQKRELELEEARRLRRAEQEAFAQSQREKGLELHNKKWLPADEVQKMRKNDREIALAWNESRSKTVTKAVYSIFQVTDDGMLIEFHRGKIANSGVNTDIAFLFGAAKGLSAEGDYYKGNLYWCGTYSYMSRANMTRTVNAYSLDRNDAISRIRNIMNSGSNPEASTSAPDIAAGDKSDRPEVLKGSKSTGSGFFIGGSGYFVTNHHVVENARKIHVLHDSKKLIAEVVVSSKVADLSILKVDSKVAGIPFSDIEPKLGTELFAIGYPQPGIQGLSVKMTKGVVSSSKGFNDDETRFQIDAAVQPGNSGGPLINKDGFLVGIVVASLDSVVIAQATGNIPQNVNYGIKVNEIKSLLRSRSINYILTENDIKKSYFDHAINATGLVIVE